MRVGNLKKLKLPDAPGVYFFLGKNKRILYIGRATSLRDRVKSYFSNDLSETRGPKIVKMLEEVQSVDFRETDSILEAVLLEADLIKKLKPSYNTDLKDDKSDNCVVITDEDFPRVLVVRSRDLKENSLTLHATRCKLHATYGPFPESGKLAVAMKLVRKIFPFRDKCVPLSGKPCFNRQIGLCPGVCTGDISRREYRKTVVNIKRLFEGKKGVIIKSLKRDMREYARKQEFEKANEVKRQLFALEHIVDVALISDSDATRHSNILQNVGMRIEALDVAHTAGKETVGAMVVVQNGKPDKSLYRKFKIKTAIAGDDTGALRELLTRRFNHPEWGTPDIVAVDGGVAQLNAASAVLADAAPSAALVSVVKDEHHRPSRILGDTESAHKFRNDILLANREAHRFAVSFHRRRRDKI